LFVLIGQVSEQPSARPVHNTIAGVHFTGHFQNYKVGERSSIL
jgi:hypothetical protein